MPEPDSGTPAVRASDDEREAIVDRLRTAAAEGRLTLDDLTNRLDQALAAVTRADLEPLIADLPERSPPPPSPGKARRWIVSFMGGSDHRGRWRVASRCTVVNLMGGAALDLTAATVEDAETEIRVFSLMGGSDIIVPDGVHVEFSGFAFMGGNDLRVEEAAPPLPSAPVVRVRAHSIMGGTDVKRRATAGSRVPGIPDHRLRRASPHPASSSRCLPSDSRFAQWPSPALPALCDWAPPACVEELERAEVTASTMPPWPDR